MSAITVKGAREGLVLTLSPDAPTSLEELCAELRRYLEAHAAFFQGATFTLDTGERGFFEKELAALLKTVQEFGLQVVALQSQNPVTRAAALALGLDLPFVPDQVAQLTATVPEGAQPAVVIRRTVRSGQSIRFAGTVVVFGDVNPGGEIIATGDIFVWGRLRGIAHAGASGDEHAVVCALELSPVQLRIGRHIARPPEERPRRFRFWLRRSRRRPEIARVQDGTIVVEEVQLGAVPF